MEVRENRSATYVCSLDPMSAFDMELLAAIRKTVSAANSLAHVVTYKSGYAYKACKRVTVKGREPIEKEARKFLKRDENGNMITVERVVGYKWGGDIVGNKYTNSKRLDIYIHEDRRSV